MAIKKPFKGVLSTLQSISEVIKSQFSFLKKSHFELPKEFYKTIAKVRYQIPRNRIELCAMLWRKTKNPLFVFEAYCLSKEYEIKIPEWVENYFLNVSKKIIHYDCSEAEETRASVVLYNLLDMNTLGRGNIFSKYQELNYKVTMICVALDIKESNPNYTWDDVLLSTKDKGKYWQSVSPEAFHKWRREFKEESNFMRNNLSLPTTNP